ncbi:MAG: hypothetical protein M3N04_06250 [Actinomycetota bacterium]|nr:hypothetical protein [Actinomycetota bacterium]
MAEGVLTTREPNRAVLARQHLLEPWRGSLVQALERRRRPAGAVRAVDLRLSAKGATRAELEELAARLREHLAQHGRISRKELDALVGKRHAIGVGLWIDLVRVPPAGTWERPAPTCSPRPSSGSDPRRR